MNTRKQKNAAKISIHELDEHEFKTELVFPADQHHSDDFEQSFVSKRVISKQSNLVSDSCKFKPTVLTKTGHGQYCKDTMSMIRFCDVENHELIQDVTNLLIQYPTINRINLYGCKSGLTPIQAKKCRNLNQKLDLEEICPSGYQARKYYGQLSYAEFFILEVERNLPPEKKHLLQNICVVACLGDIKNNNGRVGVSGNKDVKTCMPEENYMEIDTTSALAKINCSSFISSFKNTNYFQKSLAVINNDEKEIVISEDQNEALFLNNFSIFSFTELPQNESPGLLGKLEPK